MRRITAVWGVCSLLLVGFFGVLMIVDRRAGIALPYSVPVAFAVTLLAASALFSLGQALLARRPVRQVVPPIRSAKASADRTTMVARRPRTAPEGVVLLNLEPRVRRATAVTRPVPHTIAAGSTLFLIISTAASAGLAAMYARGVTQLEAEQSITERDLRILARPVRVSPGQQIAKSSLEDHLKRIGYYAGCANHPGCYEADAQSLKIWARYSELSDAVLTWDGPEILAIESLDGTAVDTALIEPETILVQTADPSRTSTRTLSDPIPFAAIEDSPLVDAIVASEDRGFLEHHGIDFPRLAVAPIVGGGASTITMQVARLNVLHDRSRTVRRKLNEIAVAMAVERTHTKAEILDAYVNSVYIGARRGRSLHGFGAAAREFYGIDDVRQLTPLQAATLVALLNQPSRYLDDLHDGERARLRRQRNRVLGLMHKTFPERYSEAAMHAAGEQPVTFAERTTSNDALQKISRHFLDYAAVTLPPAGHVYLTLDSDLPAGRRGCRRAGAAPISSIAFRGSRRRSCRRRWWSPIREPGRCSR